MFADRRVERRRPEGAAMAEPRILATGLGIPESPRWHEGRLWFSNWGLREVVAVDPEGRTEVVASVPTTFPFAIEVEVPGAGRP
jgi:sugar lactone lactonase YvrE